MPRIIHDYDAEIVLTDELGTPVDFEGPLCKEKVYTIDPAFTKILLKDSTGTLSVEFLGPNKWYKNSMYYNGVLSGVGITLVLVGVVLFFTGITGFACKEKIRKYLKRKI